MTEDEAKTKWCPQTGGSFSSNCVGSYCMAWRWHPLMADQAWVDAVRKAAEEIGDTTPNRAKAARHVNANRETYGLPTQPFSGYCGLAGAPEPA